MSSYNCRAPHCSLSVGAVRYIVVHNENMKQAEILDTCIHYFYIFLCEIGG